MTPDLTDHLGADLHLAPLEASGRDVRALSQRGSGATTVVAQGPAARERFSSTASLTLRGATAELPLGKAAEGISPVEFAGQAWPDPVPLDPAKQADGLTITVPRGALRLAGHGSIEHPGEGQSSLQITDGHERARHSNALTAASAQRYTCPVAGNKWLVPRGPGACGVAVGLRTPSVEVRR